MKDAAGRPVRALAGALLLPLVASCADTSPPPEPGVPLELADHRARTISDLAYDFRLEIQRDPAEPIRGAAVIDLTWTDPDNEPLILDLEWADRRVEGVRVGGRPVNWTAVSDHLVIPPEALEPHGANRLEVDFMTGGDGGVRREAEFVHTLFVPDRAHALLPVFDQPDLRGTVSWEIEAPRDWEVVTNGPLDDREVDAEATSATWTFAASRPIPTYLMAFAAGSFDVVEGSRRGRSYRLLHLGLDADRVDRHAGAVFDLHARSLAWMEAYTDVPYPFGKFDMIAVPDLPYAGMEHPGVVLYRERDLLPPGEAGLAEVRRRAEIVAHESAHMWFGNLVTMAWLDDLWMKEMFAGHFATRVVEEMFPADDHDLRFMLAHHPGAGRTAGSGGARPIRRPVANLHDGLDLPTGTLHRRAPVALANLERFVSPATFREGVRRLLARYAWSSVGWDDFLEVLHPLHGGDLSAWSRTWIEGTERPVVRLVWEPGEEGRGTVAVVQEGPGRMHATWPQRLTVHGEWADRTESSTVQFRGDAARVVVWEGVTRPDLVIPNASGLEYGLFRLEDAWTERLLDRLGSLRPTLLRGAATLVVEDALRESRVEPGAVIEASLSALEVERDELLAARLGQLIGTTYREHFAGEHEHPLSDRIRSGFGDRIARARSRSLRAQVTSEWQKTILERRWVRSGMPAVGGYRSDLTRPPVRRVPALGRSVGSSVAIAIELPVVRLRPR